MKLFTNIGCLAQIRDADENIIRGSKMNDLPSIEKAWLAVKNGLILDFGAMSDLDRSAYTGFQEISIGNRLVLPTWVDSHTHLVFASWRAKEFEDRINGLTYEEIANRGGGILNSAKAIALASEDELFEAAMQRLDQLIKMGTGAIEIKSGYGLDLDAEMKMLRVINRIKAETQVPVKATFLGAHAFPSACKGREQAYVDYVINDMIPAVAEAQLADYIDVFCEKGYFNIAQTEAIMDAGAAHGLKSKIHVNQFNAFGGVKACVERNAISVDHLEELNNEDVDSLVGSATIPVALPSCSFFLSIPYTPAKKLMDADLPLALASDYNPGSTPSGNMNFVVSLACIKMNMTPNAAINAATINAAAAMEISHEVGSITVGKKASFMVFEQGANTSFIPYSFGRNTISDVYINGEKYSQ